MATLHDIERRIKSVNSTKQITSTMYMVASAKVGKSAQRLEKSKPYTNAICKMVSKLGENQQDFVHPLLKAHDDVKTTLLVVITSDKGLAGGFNSGVLHTAQKYIDDNKRAGKITKIISCGRKAYSYFEFREIQLEKNFTGLSENPKFEQAEEIGDFCINNYIDENIDEVIIISNKCKNSIEQVVSDRIILPVSSDNLLEFSNSLKLTENEDNFDKNSNFENDIVYEPNITDILSNLIPVYVRTLIFNALIDSAAGEQVARRVAMQAATDNADEIAETLTRLYNSLRQGAITTELNEIVGGSDALDG